MGNSTSDPTNEEIDLQHNIKNSFIGETEKLTHFKKGQFLKEIENEFYGNAKIYQCQQSKVKWALKDKYFENSKSLFEFLEACKIYEDLKECEFLTSLIAHFTINLQTKNSIIYNSNQYKVYLSYEYQNSNLRKEIRKKRQEKSYFMEQEIVLMIQCVLKALIYLENNGIFHQNITADTILYTDSQTFQIGIQQFITNQTHYQKCFQSPTEYLNLSPELFQLLKHRTTNPQVDKVKSDIFSLGLCALQMIRLGKVNTMYECDGFFIQERVKQSFLNQITQNYSQNLQQLISMMLEIQPEDRLDFSQALEISIDMFGDLTQNNNIPKQNQKQETIQQQQYQQFQQIPNLNQLQTSPQNQINSKSKKPAKKIFSDIKKIPKQNQQQQQFQQQQFEEEEIPPKSSQRSLSKSVKSIPSSSKVRSVSQIPAQNTNINYNRKYEYKSPKKADLKNIDFGMVEKTSNNKNLLQHVQLSQKIQELEKKLEERENFSKLKDTQNQYFQQTDFNTSQNHNFNTNNKNNEYKETLHSKFLDNMVSHLNIHLHQSLTPSQVEQFLEKQEYKSNNLTRDSPEKLDYYGKQYTQHSKSPIQQKYQDQSEIKFNTEPDFQFYENNNNNHAKPNNPTGNLYRSPNKQENAKKSIKIDEFLTTQQSKISNQKNPLNQNQSSYQQFTKNVFSGDLKKSQEIPISNNNNNYQQFQPSEFQVNNYENQNQIQQRPTSQFTFSKQQQQQNYSKYPKQQQYEYSSDSISLMKKSNISLKQQMENLEKRLETIENSQQKNQNSQYKPEIPNKSYDLQQILQNHTQSNTTNNVKSRNNSQENKFGYKPYVPSNLSQENQKNHQNFNQIDINQLKNPVTSNEITKKLNSSRPTSQRRSNSPIYQQQIYKKSSQSPVKHEYISQPYLPENNNYNNQQFLNQNKNQYSQPPQRVNVLKPIDIQPITQSINNNNINNEHLSYYNYKNEQQQQQQQEILEKISERAQKLQDYFQQSKASERSHSHSPNNQPQIQQQQTYQQQQQTFQRQNTSYNFLQLPQNSKSPYKNNNNNYYQENPVRQVTSIYVNEKHKKHNHSPINNNNNHNLQKISEIQNYQKEENPKSLREENEKMQQLLDKYQNTNQSKSPNKQISQIYSQKITNLQINNQSQKPKEKEKEKQIERSSYKSNQTLASSNLAKINLDQDHIFNQNSPNLPFIPQTQKQSKNQIDFNQENLQTEKKLNVNHNHSKSFSNILNSNNPQNLNQEDIHYLQFASKDKYDVKLQFQFSQEYLSRQQQEN